MIDSGTLGMLVRTFIVTGGMIGVLMFLARAAKKGRLDGVLSRWGASRSQDGVQITSRAQASKDSTIVTVAWDGYEYLVALSQGSIHVIANRKQDSHAVEPSADFEQAFRDASSDRQTEDMMATTLATQPLIERLRHMTSRHIDGGAK